MGKHFDRPSRAALQARAALVAPLIAQGLTQGEIVRRTGLTQQWVSAYMRRPQAEVETPGRRRDAQTRAALEARRVAAMRAYAEGMGQVEIARRWQVSAATVCRWVAALTRGGAAALRGTAITGRPKREATP
jgi:transposase